MKKVRNLRKSMRKGMRLEKKYETKYPFEFNVIQCTKHFKRQLLTIKSQL